MDSTRLSRETQTPSEETDDARLVAGVEAETEALLHPPRASRQNQAGGASPLAPPKAFARVLDGLRGRPVGQALVLRRLQRDYGNSFVGKTLQARVRVSQPGDAQEREAESLANSLISPPQTTDGAAPGESSTASAAGFDKQAPAPAQREGGQGEVKQLPVETRLPMEALGGKLDDVRIHTGNEAGEAARSLNAKAFTAGRDIYFAEGEYNPLTQEGGRLLAHELAHVVQQETQGAGALIQRDEDEKQEEKKPDTATQVMNLMSEPLWSISGDAFKLLNGLEINYLLRTMSALRDAGQLTELMQGISLASGVHTPRLMMAMKAVLARKGSASAERFALANRAPLETMNPDQRLAVLRFIGPIPEQPLGEVLKIGEHIYVIVQGEVRYGKEGEDTKTWRTNNPGALTVPPEKAVTPKEQAFKQSIEEMMKAGKAYQDPADRFGYKWDEHEGGAKLAVFPSVKDGEAALALKLKGFQDRRATLEDFGSSQLGSKDAGAGYAELIVTILQERSKGGYRSVTIHTRMNEINLADIVAATKQREGWNPHKKGVCVEWSDAAALAELPVAVQFRVMLAQWMSASKPPAESK